MKLCDDEMSIGLYLPPSHHINDLIIPHNVTTHTRSVTAPAEESDNETMEEDQEQEEEEGGIISESVSASSVIQMFGGVGKFKKTASPSCASPGEVEILKMSTIKT